MNFIEDLTNEIEFLSRRTSVSSIKPVLFLLEKMIGECDPYGRGVYGSKKSTLFFKNYFRLSSLLQSLSLKAPEALPEKLVSTSLKPILSLTAEIESLMADESLSNFKKFNRFVILSLII